MAMIRVNRSRMKDRSNNRGADTAGCSNLKLSSGVFTPTPIGERSVLPSILSPPRSEAWTAVFRWEVQCQESLLQNSRFEERRRLLQHVTLSEGVRRPSRRVSTSQAIPDLARFASIHRRRFFDSLRSLRMTSCGVLHEAHVLRLTSYILRLTSNV